MRPAGRESEGSPALEVDREVPAGWGLPGSREDRGVQAHQAGLEPLDSQAFLGALGDGVTMDSQGWRVPPGPQVRRQHSVIALAFYHNYYYEMGHTHIS